MKVGALIFDMDGVIFDTERVSNLSWKLAEKEFGIHASDEFLQSLLGINRKDAAPLYEKYLGDPALGDRIYEWRHHWIEEKYTREGVPIKKGVLEIFAYLKEKHIPSALATSSPRKTVDVYFAGAKLRNDFDVVITGDTLTNGKPHPEIYLKAAQALKMDIHACMVVEDSMWGVMGGIASGAMTVMVPDLVQPNPEFTEGLFAVKDSLLDVIDLIEELNQGN
jgi:HAD superfamily hydrolase (TIGR01509 family)